MAHQQQEDIEDSSSVASICVASLPILSPGFPPGGLLEISSPLSCFRMSTVQQPKCISLELNRLGFARQVI
uniref:Cl3646_1 n=1 Tax=Arundo donax TaxID=35708 RepID=A0A0A9GB43_ARUDO